MKIKKEDPSKVIIIPRPPRSNNQEWVPLTPEDAAQEEVDPSAQHVDPIIPVDPGFGPMNNQVEGPAAGLAGVPASEEAEDE